jgi:hypothetical protein
MQRTPMGSGRPTAQYKTSFLSIRCMLALREMIHRVARGRGNVLILSHGSHGRNIENRSIELVCMCNKLKGIECLHEHADKLWQPGKLQSPERSGQRPVSVRKAAHLSLQYIADIQKGLYLTTDYQSCHLVMGANELEIHTYANSMLI